MWQRFTERARKVVFYAQEEAGRLGATDVSSEHLLLGLVRENDSVAARVLDRLGVSLRRIRSETKKQIGLGAGHVAGKDMQLTHAAKRVIDYAYDEARQLNDNYIRTEHLLLGLIREDEGLSGRVLSKLGADLDRARREIAAMQVLSDQPRGKRSAELPGFPEEIAKRFVPTELYDAVIGLRNVECQLRELPTNKQYERAYELQNRRNDLQHKINELFAKYEEQREGRDEDEPNEEPGP